MNIFTARYHEFIIHYFSDINYSTRFPVVWVIFDRKRNLWFLGGNSLFLTNNISKKFLKSGFKTQTRAFSVLFELFNRVKIKNYSGLNFEIMNKSYREFIKFYPK